MAEDPPPPYHDPSSSFPLVVQLQVWHYMTLSRSRDLNERLAVLFRNHFRDNNLHEWSVLVPDQEEVADVDLHDKDEYVPVEVQFCHGSLAYNHPGDPGSEVRTLFFATAPQIIYRFFIEIHSTPCNVNVFPVGVPETYMKRYTHVYILNTCGIREDQFFVPDPARNDDVQSWLRASADTLANVMGILAAIVNTYVLYRRFQNLPNGNWRDIDAAWFGAGNFHDHVPNQLGELRAIFDQFRQLPDNAGQPAAPAADVRGVIAGVEGVSTRHEDLRANMEVSLQRLKDGQDISNQDLYELLRNSRDTLISGSELQQAIYTAIGLLNNNYTRRTSAMTGGAVVGALAVVATICWWNPVGWTAGAVAAAGAGGGAAGAVFGAGLH